MSANFSAKYFRRRDKEKTLASTSKADIGVLVRAPGVKRKHRFCKKFKRERYIDPKRCHKETNHSSVYVANEGFI